MSILRRLCLAAFLADLSLYLIMLVLPFEALRLGASSLVLGIAPGLYAGVYSVVAVWSGRGSDRWPRRRLARIGCLLASAAALAIGRADVLFWLLAFVPGLGLGLGLFWAPVQAMISDAAPPARLERWVSAFNVSWSAGKGLGLIVGGLLLHRIGAGGVTTLSAIALLSALVLVPAVAKPTRPNEDIVEPEDLAHATDERARFRKVAWITNGLAFGVGATINYHFPKLLSLRGYDAEQFGFFLGGVYLLQTIGFVVLGRHRWWHYQRAPLAAAAGMVAIAALLLPAFLGSVPLATLAPILGAGIGFAYMSSLYYSLHAPSDRGRHAGVHEALLGASTVVLPFVAGIAATLANDERAPYVVAAFPSMVMGFVAWKTLARPSRVHS